MPFDLRYNARRAGIAVLLVATIGGCAHAPPEAPADIAQRPVATPGKRPDPALALLDYARRLQNATPEQREQHVVTARRAVSEYAGANSFARLALAYGTPNQRRYTPDEAARYAQRALDAEDNHWSPAARQYLSDCARLYQAVADNNQTTAPAHQAEARPEAAQDQATQAAGRQARADSNARADADRAHIARLQAQLDEAHRKLRELANIEDRLGDTEP
ncbi:hypothetical protein [Salinisphaera aquimarina]|uniref:Lipoprotein n=1 Tax=Salinisphaera aquimarina TaxID=2094031 RepID=A0ABV7EKG3_9GAMM